MRQHITKEQWDEIEMNHKGKFFFSLEHKPEIIQREYDESKKRKGVYIPSWHLISLELELELPSIGQMIEFLGDEWFEVIAFNHNEEVICLRDEEKELIDALWEAVKYKLKQ